MAPPRIVSGSSSQNQRVKNSLLGRRSRPCGWRAIVALRKAGALDPAAGGRSSPRGRPALSTLHFVALRLAGVAARITGDLDPGRGWRPLNGGLRAGRAGGFPRRDMRPPCAFDRFPIARFLLRRPARRMGSARAWPNNFRLVYGAVSRAFPIAPCSRTA
jgi:hypothetical protein